jgi:transcriptional regulator with XRE-family HTH domain
MSSYNTLVGERLRAIRRRRGLSLQDVQRRSEGEFKAAVLGAYERGERSLSVERLHGLAGFYGVPESMLLPTGGTGAGSGDDVVVDLTRIDRLDGPAGEILERYIESIRRERRDPTGDVLTVRREDLRVLSRLLGDEHSLDGELDALRPGDGTRRLLSKDGDAPIPPVA